MPRKRRIISAPDCARHQALLAPWHSFTLDIVHPTVQIASSRSLRYDLFRPVAAEKQRLATIRTSCLYLTPENEIPRTSFCQKTLQIATSSSKTRTSLQNKACHVSKNGQARRRLVEPPGSNTKVCLDFVSITLWQEEAASRLFLQKLLSHEAY